MDMADVLQKGKEYIGLHLKCAFTNGLDTSDLTADISSLTLFVVP